AARSVAVERPRQQAAAVQQSHHAAVPHHRAVGQAAHPYGPRALLPRTGIDPLLVQPRVDVRCPPTHRLTRDRITKVVRAAPGGGEGEEVGAPAVRARSMAGGEGARLVEKEQCGPPARRHRIAYPSLPIQHAADPRLAPPTRHAEATLRVMQAAAVAREQAAARVGDDLAGRQHPVLQGHETDLRTGPPRASLSETHPYVRSWKGSVRAARRARTGLLRSRNCRRWQVTSEQ